MRCVARPRQNVGATLVVALLRGLINGEDKIKGKKGGPGGDTDPMPRSPRLWDAILVGRGQSTGDEFFSDVSTDNDGLDG